MQILKLDSKQVAAYEERGFKLLEPLQQVIFEIIFEQESHPSMELTWSQLRGCVRYISDPVSGRRERVKNLQKFLFIFKILLS